MRQFILEKNLEKDGTVTLEGKDFKYLRQVLRVRPGDMISLRLADGSLQNSTVTKVDEKAKWIQLQICDTADKSITRGVQAIQIQEEQTKADSFPGQIEYILLQFVPRPQKFEQIVRQAVECGVKYIVPVFGEYSEKSSIQALSGNANKKERLERIVKEARQQSGSPVESVVTEPMTLERAVEFAEGALGFVLSERDEGSVKISEVLAQNKNVQRIAIACGSEGGISPKEVEFLCKKGLFLTVHFSVNILRCETAALYGIAAVQTAV